jgi:3-oxoacyl-[acyl-carrier protein] reductase
VKVDITNVDEVNRMVKATLDNFGHVDILANIAGGSEGPVIKTKYGPFAESTPERWEDMINLNLYGTLYCTRVVINHMIERRYGKIVNFASIAAMLGFLGQAPYAAAKAGIIGFTKTLAKEVATQGITVNCISPGILGSERVYGLGKERVEVFGKSIRMGKIGSPEDAANAVLFLSSDESNYITGHNIPVDGGMHLGPLTM